MKPKIYKGDMVKVDVSIKKLLELDVIDPESAHYVSIFNGQEGQVFDITTSSGGYENYHVNFGKEIGIFYRDEVTLSE